MRTAVAERSIPCEGSFSGWNQRISLRHVVNVVDRVAAACFEIGRKNGQIDGSAHFGQNVRFERKMPAQRGVTSAGQRETHAHVCSRILEVARDLEIELASSGATQ